MSNESSAGRTLVALNLFRTAVLHGLSPVQLACYDIEKPDLIEMVDVAELKSEDIFAPQPVIDITRCRYCGVCSGYCPEKAIQFNRFVPSVTVIVSRCFACGKCFKGCDRNGIILKDKFAGNILQGRLAEHFFIAGYLHESSELKIPLVKAINERLNPDATVICDFGPGTESSICQGIAGTDYAVIVLTPKPEWEKELDTLLEMLRNYTVSAGVILNKVTSETVMLASLKEYCKNNSIPFLGVIPLDKKLLREPENENPGDSEVFSPEFDEIWNNLADTLQATILHQKETSNSTYIFN